MDRCVNGTQQIKLMCVHNFIEKKISICHSLFIIKDRIHFNFIKRRVPIYHPLFISNKSQNMFSDLTETKKC